MSGARRDILVTSALPYANGSIHIGHLVEYIQTDIWVRFQRLRGHQCTYVCASDAHGTPIMLKARELGISPEELVEHYREEHQRDFAAFLVDFDNYHSTHSPENQRLVEAIYARLDAGGHIVRRVIRQAYDEQAGMFLPDRFVRGNCPHCGAEDQYGDSCEVCSRTYSPSELRNPRSVISGTPPVERESEHYFFRLGDFEASLREWTRSGVVDAGVARKLDEWFEAGLQDWDISRDAPYFGFRIPGTEDKYFYVWLDAPIGYIASLENLAQRSGGPGAEAYFGAESAAELYHFIGKDIAYFHTLFWPAVLEGSGHRKPSGVFVHGFLTVNGQKMSKSRGTFVSAATYLEHLPPEFLRYYYACKLGPGLEDIDLNLEDFVSRTNADLVGKFVNIASRCAGFIQRGFDGELAVELEDPELYAEFSAAAEPIAALYEAREYGKAMREIMALADRANQYIDAHKPWLMVKDPAQADRVQAVCTQGLNLFRALLTYLKPVLPATARAAEAFLGGEALAWSSVERPLLGRRIDAFRPLLRRIEMRAVERMIEASKAPAAGETEAAAPEEISIDEFLRSDLVVAEVQAAEQVPGADKLLKLTLDLGGERRTVFAGIRAAYAPESLVGRLVVVVANLKPRKMRFGTSEGMVLAAGNGEQDVFLISPDSGAKPGMRVR
ncbi:MAG: methionine--tRNA ligase [Gammaproteobacteria bacterium]|nr:MAG: methionine--tRNA ligase [Gammaproteobacteria bacterium]